MLCISRHGVKKKIKKTQILPTRSQNSVREKGQEYIWAISEVNSETAEDRHFAKDQGRNFWSRWNLNSVLKDRDTSYSDKERAMGEGVTDRECSRIRQ